MQISDGVTEYFPAQRADQFVASLEHRFNTGIEFRMEAYHKDYKDLRPRFENLLNTFVILPEIKPDRVRIAPQGQTLRPGDLVEVRAARLKGAAYAFRLLAAGRYRRLRVVRSPWRLTPARAVAALVIAAAVAVAVYRLTGTAAMARLVEKASFLSNLYLL